MKCDISFDPNKQDNLFRGFRLSPRISMKFSYCTDDDFHDWLDRNQKRMIDISQKWGWSIEIAYSATVVIFHKNKKYH